MKNILTTCIGFLSSVFSYLGFGAFFLCVADRIPRFYSVHWFSTYSSALEAKSGESLDVAQGLEMALHFAGFLFLLFMEYLQVFVVFIPYNFYEERIDVWGVIGNVFLLLAFCVSPFRAFEKNGSVSNSLSDGLLFLACQYLIMTIVFAFMGSLSLLIAVPCGILVALLLVVAVVVVVAIVISSLASLVFGIEGLDTAALIGVLPQTGYAVAIFVLFVGSGLLFIAGNYYLAKWLLFCRKHLVDVKSETSEAVVGFIKIILAMFALAFLSGYVDFVENPFSVEHLK